MQALNFLSYFNGFKNAVIEVWEARILIHHAVDEFCELHQEGFAVGKAIVLQRLNQWHYVGYNLV